MGLEELASKSAEWLLRAGGVALVWWLWKVGYPDWRDHQTKMLQAQSDMGQVLNTLTTILIAYLTSNPKDAMELHKIFWHAENVTEADLELLVSRLKGQGGD